MRNVPVYSISEISKVIQFPVDEVEQALFYPDYPKHILINDDSIFGLVIDLRREYARHLRNDDSYGKDAVSKTIEIVESIIDAFNGKLPREFFIEK